MLANSQWTSYQWWSESCWRQLDCHRFGYSSPELSSWLLVDLSTESRGLENYPHGEELDLYVDLAGSPSDNCGDDGAQTFNEKQILSMEAQRTTVADQADSRHQARMPIDVITCVSNLQSRCTEIEDEGTSLGCEICRPGADETCDAATSDDTSAKSLPKENLPNQSGSIKISDASGKDKSRRFGKRPCEASVVQNSKKRKVTQPIRMSLMDNNCSPVKVGDISTSCFLKAGRDASKGTETVGEGTGVAEGKDRKSSKCTMLSQVCSSSARDDISPEEAAAEFQQVVSLLKDYGMLRGKDSDSIQNLSSCVPHPGHVGDKLVSTGCKVCGAPEDANSTVICDECQEAFHLACSNPRISSRFFDREDDWYCASCRKNKRKVNSKLTESCPGVSSNVSSFKRRKSGLVDKSDKICPVGTSYNSKVRLGQAHQAGVPLWTGRIDEDRCFSGQPGTENPISQEEKDGEKHRILKAFREKVQCLNWLPANMLPSGSVENWLKCQNIVKPAHKDSDGRKHSEVICGKWRRAPVNVNQSYNWECFCVMEWDPMHADCAIPQELPTEEIFRRMQATVNGKSPEVLEKKVA